jgi:hypothetical protein
LQLSCDPMLYFVDESGIDLKEAPCSVLAGVGIVEANVWPFAQAFLRLKEDILRFPPEQLGFKNVQDA